MRKINNIIEINGQRYDAVTGALLTPGASSRAKTHLATAKHPAPRDLHSRKHHVTRQPARHHSSHPPAAPRTLMRQAVSKPRPTLKHRLKAQGHTDTLIQSSLPDVTLKQSAFHLDEKRLQHAKRIPKSQLISRFSQFSVNPDTSGSGLGPTGNKAVTPGQPTSHHRQAPNKPANTHAKPSSSTEKLLEHALQQATSYRELPTGKRHRFRVRRHAGIGL
jgi:hypothetical protein